MKLKLYIIIIFLTGCSLFNVEQGTSSLLQDYRRYEKKDYITSLNLLAQNYISKNREKVIPFPQLAVKLFDSIVKKIEKNNELLLPKAEKLKLFLIKDSRAFHFSLPGGYCFFSVGLIHKYLRNEDFFRVVLITELIKLQKELYRKEIIIPLGDVKIDRLISLTKLPSDLNYELAKHVYLALERSSYDPYVLLLWVQSKNKNSLDFSLLYKDLGEITFEEQNIKTFIIKKEKEIKYATKERSSSGNFYKFLKYVDRVKL